MALTKTILEDKIEIIGQYKSIQIRTSTIIKEDGVEISRTYSRKTLNSGTLDSSNNLVDTDVSSESAEVRGIAALLWTNSVKTAYRTFLISQLIPTNEGS
tara:strand:+ start:530 stop:829 length:300 start_codon:yes stop_codon:yes gene_type:complete